MQRLPAEATLLYSGSDIEQRLGILGERVTEWAEEKPLVAVCILRGAVYVFADLLRKLPLPVQSDFWRVSTYTENREKIGTAKPDSVSVDLSGARVLLCDEICDSGETLASLTNYCRAQGAEDVKSLVVVNRIIAGKDYEPDWSCFNFNGAEWLVGYGCDDSNVWSNLPDMYTLPSS